MKVVTEFLKKHTIAQAKCVARYSLEGLGDK